LTKIVTSMQLLIIGDKSCKMLLKKSAAECCLLYFKGPVLDPSVWRWADIAITFPASADISATARPAFVTFLRTEPAGFLAW